MFCCRAAPPPKQEVLVEPARAPPSPELPFFAEAVADAELGECNEFSAQAVPCACEKDELGVKGPEADFHALPPSLEQPPSNEIFVGPDWRPSSRMAWKLKLENIALGYSSESTECTSVKWKSEDTVRKVQGELCNYNADLEKMFESIGNNIGLLTQIHDEV